jgi:hypothetical protein
MAMDGAAFPSIVIVQELHCAISSLEQKKSDAKNNKNNLVLIIIQLANRPFCIWLNSWSKGLW